MVRRRCEFDPLEVISKPRWYVVWSMHGKVIESRQLAARADLKREFVAALVTWVNDGWQVGEFASASGTFFCDRNPERRMVSIEPTDPNNTPAIGSGYFGGCPSCGDS
jgi:hypothetical protein